MSNINNIDITQIPIFVATIESATERRARLTTRLKHHKLLSQTKFVYGFNKDSDLIKWWGYGSNSSIIEYATFYTHLKCIRSFVESKADIGLILEDDIIFKNTFVDEINQLLKEKIKNLLLLTCIKFDNTKTSNGIHKITPYIYGAQGYLISREYAISLLYKFDTCGFNITKNRLTSEIITINSYGNYILPPLIIEECYSSIMNHNVKNHMNAFKKICNFKDYEIAECDLIKRNWK